MEIPSFLSSRKPEVQSPNAMKHDDSLLKHRAPENQGLSADAYHERFDEPHEDAYL